VNHSISRLIRFVGKWGVAEAACAARLQSARS